MLRCSERLVKAEMSFPPILIHKPEFYPQSPGEPTVPWTRVLVLRANSNFPSECQGSFGGCGPLLALAKWLAAYSSHSPTFRTKEKPQLLSSWAKPSRLLSTSWVFHHPQPGFYCSRDQSELWWREPAWQLSLGPTQSPVGVLPSLRGQPSRPCPAASGFFTASRFWLMLCLWPRTVLGLLPSIITACFFLLFLFANQFCICS